MFSCVCVRVCVCVMTESCDRHKKTHLELRFKFSSSRYSLLYLGVCLCLCSLCVQCVVLNGGLNRRAYLSKKKKSSCWLQRCCNFYDWARSVWSVRCMCVSERNWVLNCVSKNLLELGSFVLCLYLIKVKEHKKTCQKSHWFVFFFSLAP